MTQSSSARMAVHRGARDFIFDLAKDFVVIMKDGRIHKNTLK